MSDSRLLDIARQGDPRAIGTLLNAVLLPKRVKASVVRQAEELMITLHSEKMLNQGAAVTLIHTALERLHLPKIQRVFIESRVLGVPLWESHFSLQLIPAVQPPPPAIAESQTAEPSPPEPTLLDLMSAFTTSQESATPESQDTMARSPQEKEQPTPAESTPEHSDTVAPKVAALPEPVATNGGDGTVAKSINELQESFAEEPPEIATEEDRSAANLATASDSNTPSELPDVNRGEPTSDLSTLQGNPLESDPLGEFSGALPAPTVAVEPLSSPVEEPLEAQEESITTPEAQASVPGIPELSKATPAQVSIEEYNFPEPTPEDLAALDTLEIESSAPVETPFEAESSPGRAIASAPTADAPPQAQEPVDYPPLVDPWLEAEPAPQVQADRTQETPPSETARASPPPPSESEIYTTPTLERVPRNGLTRATAIVGILMGLGFCATLLGVIIGLPLLVGSLCMLAEEEVWQGECPHCHQPLKIPRRKQWRFSCEKCQGLIEVKHGRFYARQAPLPPTPNLN
ncbi:MAG: hypothetical protein ACK4HN_01465 [Thermosynechococcus sp.]|uniref:hypothetical protein n=1 Tax=Thermosynechococcus sp. TaxID=2814275 RepID=UPI00391D645C